MKGFLYEQWMKLPLHERLTPRERDFEAWDESSQSVHIQFADLLAVKSGLQQKIPMMKGVAALEVELKDCLKLFFALDKLIEARLSGWQPKGGAQ